ncbi:MAG: nucleotidyltransferase domain-containing protein [Burkholderiales bacterium]
MAKDKNPKHAQMRLRIAAAAARMMAEDGIEDFAAAKRKAARMLGASDTQSMPGNDEIEAELRIYLALYKHDEHSSRLRELRERALELMDELAEFRPYLAGSVLKGTAGRYADIDLRLFTDDSKLVEIFFINRGLEFATGEFRYYCGGDEPRVVPVLQVDWDDVPVNIAVCDRRDERAALKSSPTGRPVERANAAAVAELLAREDEAAMVGDQPADDEA